MRESLQVSHSTLPGFTQALPPLVEKRMDAQLEEWKKSDFAGFRRILEAGSDCHPDLEAIRKTVSSHKMGASGKKIRDFVILGIGGSSLGAEAILRALHPSLSEPRFHIADNSDPATFRWLLNGLRAEETLFYVVAKSGSTPETLSQFFSYLYVIIIS